MFYPPPLRLDSVIPYPAKTVPGQGTLKLKGLPRLAVPACWESCRGRFLRQLRHFGLQSSESAPLLEIRQGTLPEDLCWGLRISPEGLVLTATGTTALNSGLGALTQLIAQAAMTGPAELLLPCGEIFGKAPDGWRGLMLDSARHFQHPEAVIGILEAMASLQFNTLHWHLTDNQGWRYPSAVLPEMNSRGQYSDGMYSREDLKLICRTAKELGIAIVPELDLPGHSQLLLQTYPRFACNPDHPGEEICIGNPETHRTAEALLDELMEIFPDSAYIHLGGDEAQTGQWEKCPVCRKLVADGQARDFRDLEFQFMSGLAEHVLKRGRTPVVWGPPGTDPELIPGTVIQVWLQMTGHWRASARNHESIFSFHHSCYLDYPENADDPSKSWMFNLKEEDVFRALPAPGENPATAALPPGMEFCLWTEMVPEWRLGSKLFPRLYAAAEAMATPYPNRKWHDYLARRQALDNAGYTDLLIGGIHKVRSLCSLP